MPVLYLHGFASGPGSKKARFFGERLRARGVECDTPDLAAGDFAGLTITGQLRTAEAAIAGRRVCLMGSSLGGYLAALLAEAHPDLVDRVMLMAPAFDFAARWRARLGEATFAEWERTNALEVFHYGEGRPAAVRFSLYSDALQYAPFPHVSQPALVFHGRADDVVPYELSERFAALMPGAQLRLVDSGHELVDVTEAMWEETCRFFGIAERPI
ncbi:MAG: alpha/beta fold hydrolase [Bryobacterales bacterium]|nr:alpha/beta fold hydrolase [Bryobacterales bacterium]